MNKKIVKYSVLSTLLLLVLTLVTGCEVSMSYDSRPDIRESETSNLEEVKADKVYMLVAKGKNNQNLLHMSQSLLR